MPDGPSANVQLIRVQDISMSLELPVGKTVASNTKKCKSLDRDSPKILNCKSKYTFVLVPPTISSSITANTAAFFH